MTKYSPFRYFKTSPGVIRLPVMTCIRYPLSWRNVEDLLHERGIDISYETVRFWWHRFGPLFASKIRKRRVSGIRSSHWRWHLDEVFVKINSERHYLWRVVDHEGEVLEAYVSKTRDRKAALRFFSKTMNRHGRPHALVTDKLWSYGAALKDLGVSDNRETGRWLNNRAENFHWLFRRRERAMLRFHRKRSPLKFVAVHSSIQNLFNAERTLSRRDSFKASRAAALSELRQLCAALHRADLGKQRLVRIGLMVWTTPPRRHRNVPCWCCRNPTEGRSRPHGDYNTRDRSGQVRPSASRR
jgi:putative transposase